MTEEVSLRRVERLREGKWVEVRMKELIPGDRFRMFEDDGETVSSQFGTEWYVTGIPKVMINENGVQTWGVAAKTIVDPSTESPE